MMNYVSYDVKKNSFSSFAGSNDACLLFTTILATLNTCSEGTDVVNTVEPLI